MCWQYYNNNDEFAQETKPVSHYSANLKEETSQFAPLSHYVNQRLLVFSITNQYFLK
jgi:hypothetical protein